MPHKLPDLKFNFSDLEPFIDSKTVELHYSKHHQNYCNNLNKALENLPEFKDKPIEQVLSDTAKLPQTYRTAIINNGGGYYNHNLYWLCLSPNPKKEPGGDLMRGINAQFGSLDSFVSVFSDSASKLFGSGWAWLVKDGSSLQVISTQNQDTPLSLGYTPMIALDLWEHSYYLKYQNRRSDYVQAWWNILDWKTVETLFSS